jgi:WD40 domain-containing protein
MNTLLPLATVVVGGLAMALAAQSNPAIDKQSASSQPASSVAFSPDGKFLTNSTSQPLQIWDVATGQPIASATFSPGGRQLITSSLGETVRIWDAVTGKELFGPHGLVGTWQLVSIKHGPDGQSSAPPAGQRKVKLITGTHFTWIVYEAGSRKVLHTAGGTYSLQGDTYTEQIEFAGDGMTDDVGKPQLFKIWLDGDKLHQSGQLSDGTRIEEVWEGLK